MIAPASLSPPARAVPRPRVIVADNSPDYALPTTSNTSGDSAGDWLQLAADNSLLHQLTQVDLSQCRLLCLGRGLDDDEAQTLAAQLEACDTPPVLMLHATGSPQPPRPLQPFLRYYHPQPLPPAVVQDLITRLLDDSGRAPLLNPAQLQLARDLADELSHQEDWEQSLGEIAITLAEVVPCRRSHILTWQHQSATSPPGIGAPGSRLLGNDVVLCHNDTGIAGYVRQTAASARVEDLPSDPRFAPALDLPADSNGEHHASGHGLFLPLLPLTPAPAVLRLYRDSHAAPFSAAEEQLARTWLQVLQAPLQRLWLLRARPDDDAAALRLNSPALDNPIYRREAVQQLVEGVTDDDHVLAERDRFTHWTYRILLLCLAVLAAYLWLGRAHEYAVGPTIIRANDRSELSAPGEGAVSNILVTPGQQVSVGQPLLTLHQGQQLAELQQLEQEFQARLRQRLLNPDDTQLEAVLINLRSQVALARSRLAERTISAPRDGTVGDILVRQGQYVSTGRTLLTLSHGEERRSLVALIPGSYRPQLKPSMPLRLELNGYPYDYQKLTVARVDDQVIGPQQARFYLGTAIGDTLNIDGPVVLVHAELPPRFTSRDGTLYDYHDGMQGTVEIRLRSEPIIYRLLPDLKGLGAEGASNR